MDLLLHGSKNLKLKSKNKKLETILKNSNKRKYRKESRTNRRQNKEKE